MTLKWVRFDDLTGPEHWVLDMRKDNNVLLRVWGSSQKPGDWLAEVRVGNTTVISQGYSNSTRLEAQRAAVTILHGWITAVQERVKQIEEPNEQIGN